MPEVLTENEARARLLRDGPNELPVSRPRTALRLLGDVSTEPMFMLLVACGGIYLALGDRNEALMLLGFVFAYWYHLCPAAAHRAFAGRAS
ncbi:MAG: cation-transporting P-type ATPase [Marinobacter sp.]|nr:cation-transporting P-type ATPase [Marinobacter sp.]